MTYRLLPLTLVHALTFISTANAEIAVDPLVIARRCCSHQAATCCAKTIENRLPLNCSLPLEELVSTSNCIQTAIYGMKSMQFVRIEDVECCQVFSDDFTDDSKVCLSTCAQTLRSPSLRPIVKLKTIKSCRPESKNYSCFRRCQSFVRSRTNQSEKFPYLAVCDLASRLQANALYIGPELND